ncbi:MAG: DUF6557 family protein [Sedimentibacter sp.]
MIFKELLKTVAFDDVWTELNKEYSLKDEAFEAYLGVFNQLKELTPEPNHDGFRLAVVKVEDEFEPGKFVYDVFGIKLKDKEHYALEMSPWKEWLSLIVIEKCIETYGSATVVAHSLYELTFFGYDAIDVEAKIEKEFEILKERQEEIENGTSKYVSWNELYRELGYVDARTEEEKELEYKQFERIMAENKRIYEVLLS